MFSLIGYGIDHTSLKLPDYVRFSSRCISLYVYNYLLSHLFTQFLALHSRNFTKSLEILGNSWNPRVKLQFCEFTEIVSNFVNFLSLWIYCNIYTVQTINNSPSPQTSRCFLLCSLCLCSLLLCSVLLCSLRLCSLLCLRLLCSLCLNVSRQEAIIWVLKSSVVVYKASFTRWTEQGIDYNLLHPNCLRLWLLERNRPIGCLLLQENYQHQFLVIFHVTFNYVVIKCCVLFIA